MHPVSRIHARRRRHQDVEALLAVLGLRGADRRRLAELAPYTDRLRLPPGRALAHAGRTARELIVIVAGEAAVLDGDGVADVLHAGARIGGDEVLRNERHAATVVTASEVEVVVLNGPAVLWAHREGLVAIGPSRPSVPAPALTGRPDAHERRNDASPLQRSTRGSASP